MTGVPLLISYPETLEAVLVEHVASCKKKNGEIKLSLPGI